MSVLTVMTDICATSVDARHVLLDANILQGLYGVMKSNKSVTVCLNACCLMLHLCHVEEPKNGTEHQGTLEQHRALMLSNFEKVTQMGIFDVMYDKVRVALLQVGT